jgi:hypothetical protein
MVSYTDIDTHHLLSGEAKRHELSNASMVLPAIHIIPENMEAS